MSDSWPLEEFGGILAENLEFQGFFLAKNTKWVLQVEEKVNSTSFDMFLEEERVSFVLLAWNDS